MLRIAGIFVKCAPLLRRATFAKRLNRYAGNEIRTRDPDLGKVGVASSNLVSRSNFSVITKSFVAGIAQLVEHVPRHEVIAKLGK